MAPGQPAPREWEYIHRGTLTLHRAFAERTGKVFGFVSEGYDQYAFLELPTRIDRFYPRGRGHIVLDNLSAQDNDVIDAWY